MSQLASDDLGRLAVACGLGVDDLESPVAQSVQEGLAELLGLVAALGGQRSEQVVDAIGARRVLRVVGLAVSAKHQSGHGTLLLGYRGYVPQWFRC